MGSSVKAVGAKPEGLSRLAAPSRWLVPPERQDRIRFDDARRHAVELPRYRRAGCAALNIDDDGRLAGIAGIFTNADGQHCPVRHQAGSVRIFARLPRTIFPRLKVESLAAAIPDVPPRG